MERNKYDFSHAHIRYIRSYYFYTFRLVSFHSKKRASRHNSINLVIYGRTRHPLFI